MITRRDARTDENQPEILDALNKVGAWYCYIKYPLDLLIAYRGKLYIGEIKREGAKLNKNQQKVFKELMLRGVIPLLIETPEDALMGIGAISPL
jgi:hypothetical protein